MPKRGSAAAIAHLEQVKAFCLDAAKAPVFCPEVACELMAAGSKIMAHLLDYLKTGEMHVDDPCSEAVLAAGELTEQDDAIGLLHPDDVAAVLRGSSGGDSDAGTSAGRATKNQQRL